MHISEPESEIESTKWRIVKQPLTHCPDEIQFEDFLKLHEAVEDRPELRKLVTLRFHVTNTFKQRKWIDLWIETYVQNDGWEFDLSGIVADTPRHKPVCRIHPGRAFRIIGYTPSKKTANRLELLRAQD
jgi:hypothetical protein